MKGPNAPALVRATILPATLSLFFSSGSLICCALPAALVGLGMGAVMAGLIETVPGLVWFGANKELVFSIAGLALLAAGIMQWRARGLPCPTDKKLARACARLRRMSWVIWGVSVALFAIGAYFAFIAVWFI